MPHATERPEEPTSATLGPGLPARAPARPPTHRLASGLLLALVGMPVLTAILTGLGSRVDLPSALLLYLLLVVVVAVVGGFVPAAVAAVGAFLLANWYFTPPFHQFGIAKLLAWISPVDNYVRRRALLQARQAKPTPGDPGPAAQRRLGRDQRGSLPCHGVQQLGRQVHAVFQGIRAGRDGGRATLAVLAVDRHPLPPLWPR